MSKLMALAISIAVLGGVWAYVALGLLPGKVLVWAGFIAWGCYFHTGGDSAAAQKTIGGMIFGAIMAGIALLLVGHNPLGLPGGALAAAVYIAITVFPLVAASSCNSLLSVVPANVYGYAATAAYALQTPNAGSPLDPNFGNPVLLVALSVIFGVIFGILSQKLAAIIGGK